LLGHQEQWDSINDWYLKIIHNFNKNKSQVINVKHTHIFKLLSVPRMTTFLLICYISTQESTYNWISLRRVSGDRNSLFVD